MNNEIESLIQDIRENEGEKAVNEFIKQVVPSLEKGILFEGFDQDNCENCAGWNGLSYRCECGCRRVYWSYMGDIWYPQAD